MARIFVPVPTTTTSTPGLNKIVGRGFGPDRGLPGRCGPVTKGYGGVPTFVTQTLLRQINLGQSGAKRRLAEMDEVTIWAKLIEVNSNTPPKEIKGWINVRVNKNQGFASAMAEHVSTRIRDVLDYIKVTVTRIK